MTGRGVVEQVFFTELHKEARRLLAGADRRVWMASYVPPSTDIRELMSELSSHGCDVKLLVSSLHIKGAPTRGFPMTPISTMRASMHHKFVIIDDQVLTGSYNFTEWEGGNNAMVLLSGAVVEDFTQEFRDIAAAPKLPDVLRGKKAMKFVDRILREYPRNDFLEEMRIRVKKRGWLTLAEQKRLESLVTLKKDFRLRTNTPKGRGRPTRSPCGRMRCPCANGVPLRYLETTHYLMDVPGITVIQRWAGVFEVEGPGGAVIYYPKSQKYKFKGTSKIKKCQGPNDLARRVLKSRG